MSEQAVGGESTEVLPLSPAVRTLAREAFSTRSRKEPVGRVILRIDRVRTELGALWILECQSLDGRDTFGSRYWTLHAEEGLHGKAAHLLASGEGAMASIVETLDPYRLTVRSQDTILATFPPEGSWAAEPKPPTVSPPPTLKLPEHVLPAIEPFPPFQWALQVSEPQGEDVGQITLSGSLRASLQRNHGLPSADRARERWEAEKARHEKAYAERCAALEEEWEELCEESKAKHALLLRAHEQTASLALEEHELARKYHQERCELALTQAFTRAVEACNSHVRGGNS